MLYIPNIGLLSIFAAGLVRMSYFIMKEWEQKPVRINGVMSILYTTFFSFFYLLG